MAITTSKVTYSLKPETVDRVAELAEAWGVPKSEVIRRVVDRAATEQTTEPKVLTPLEAFLSIQKKGGISRKAAAKWCAEIRRERHSWRSVAE